VRNFEIPEGFGGHSTCRSSMSPQPRKAEDDQVEGRLHHGAAVGVSLSPGLEMTMGRLE